MNSGAILGKGAGREVITSCSPPLPPKYVSHAEWTVRMIVSHEGQELRNFRTFRTFVVPRKGAQGVGTLGTASLTASCPMLEAMPGGGWSCHCPGLVVTPHCP